MGSGAVGAAGLASVHCAGAVGCAVAMSLAGNWDACCVLSVSSAVLAACAVVSVVSSSGCALVSSVPLLGASAPCVVGAVGFAVSTLVDAAPSASMPASTPASKDVSLPFSSAEVDSVVAFLSCKQTFVGTQKNLAEFSRLWLFHVVSSYPNISDVYRCILNYFDSFQSLENG